MCCGLPCNSIGVNWWSVVKNYQFVRLNVFLSDASGRLLTSGFEENGRAAFGNWFAILLKINKTKKTLLKLQIWNGFQCKHNFFYIKMRKLLSKSGQVVCNFYKKLRNCDKFKEFHSISNSRLFEHSKLFLSSLKAFVAAKYPPIKIYKHAKIPWVFLIISWNFVVFKSGIQKKEFLKKSTKASQLSQCYKSVPQDSSFGSKLFLLFARDFESFSLQASTAAEENCWKLSPGEKKNISSQTKKSEANNKEMQDGSCCWGSRIPMNLNL